MPSFITTPEEEAVWERAKGKVREGYPDLDEQDSRFWALTNTIYHRMSGRVSTTGRFSHAGVAEETASTALDLVVDAIRPHYPADITERERDVLTRCALSTQLLLTGGLIQPGMQWTDHPIELLHGVAEDALTVLKIHRRALSARAEDVAHQEKLVRQRAAQEFQEAASMSLRALRIFTKPDLKAQLNAWIKKAPKDSPEFQARLTEARTLGRQYNTTVLPAWEKTKAAEAAQKEAHELEAWGVQQCASWLVVPSWLEEADPHSGHVSSDWLPLIAEGWTIGQAHCHQTHAQIVVEAIALHLHGHRIQLTDTEGRLVLAGSFYTPWHNFMLKDWILPTWVKLLPRTPTQTLIHKYLVQLNAATTYKAELAAAFQQYTELLNDDPWRWDRLIRYRSRTDWQPDMQLNWAAVIQ